ncbi:MAG: ParB/RepB/Spo0J family partition protein [Planctomycetota bacterium]|jgi:ParB family chromosome partitioning protein|nr:ParB/RepB/Spo0J family partition protein [Planctomycetota bacterium]MDP7247962.1 ParB/RepB/Spo0J family partition protein [Planctomycetota bacterium]
MKLNNPLERVRNVIHSGMGAQGEGRTFLYIQTSELDPNPFQPRLHIDEGAIEDLRRSIAEHGILEPIVVRRKEDRYEIISGERRWRASQAIEMEEVPCVMREASDEESFQLALTENIQRDDLTPLEEAQAFQKMMEMKIASNQTEVGNMLGIRQQRVSDKLKLLELPESVQQYFGERYQDRFTQKHGEYLSRLKDQKKIEQIACRIIEERLSTRETQQLIDKLLQRRPATKKKIRRPKRLNITKSRNGFNLKVSFDRRRDSIEDIVEELMKMVERLRKEFSAESGKQP